MTDEHEAHGPQAGPRPPAKRRIYFRPPGNFYSMTEDEQGAWAQNVLAPLFPDEAAPQRPDSIDG